MVSPYVRFAIIFGAAWLATKWAAGCWGGDQACPRTVESVVDLPSELPPGAYRGHDPIPPDAGP